MATFIRTELPSGDVEYVRSDYEEIMAQADASPVHPVPQDIVNLTEEQLQEKIYQNQMELFRQRRNALLSESDWTQNADSPLSSEEKTAWAVYRQQLRDLPGTYDYQTVIWPISPA